MLKYKAASIIFIISLLIIGVLHYFFFVTLWWLLLPVAIYKFQIISGSAIIDSDFFTKVYCNSTTSEKEIAITFDDGPTEYTSKVLSLLARYKVVATFFVIGKNINGKENIIREIDSAGHTIGNHTFSHSFFIDFKSTSGFMYELDATSDAVYELIRKRMMLFRPPYGVTTPNLANAAKILNYHIIGWNVRSLDTTNDSMDKIVNRVVSKIKPGAVILFHDTSDKTIDVLEQTLIFAEKNGFKIVSVGKLLTIKTYE